ncbi:cysteine-rich CWC family protein [Pseudomonas fragi]|uniref:cysteine-rich CWC family protein n=1 Tax=Pseudomonas fragi TaxID=296 RepID=UPI001F31FA7D|nr:cysteine-rich CWC family protein [Pseudomonas fragi]MCF6762314.1 cysteine-rich CWC family protein [Pseudomonas fragi]
MTTPNICPACGARNDCSMANPEAQGQPCWCYGVSIDPEVIRALPLEQRDLTCLCPRCAQVQSQLPPAPASALT